LPATIMPTTYARSSVWIERSVLSNLHYYSARKIGTEQLALLLCACFLLSIHLNLEEPGKKKWLWNERNRYVKMVCWSQYTHSVLNWLHNLIFDSYYTNLLQTDSSGKLWPSSSSFKVIECMKTPNTYKRTRMINVT
jgi:hypothetical protein